MEPYRDSGPIDCNVDVNTRHASGKSVIVTGGANGIGEAYVQAFLDVGAFVTIGDVDDGGAKKLVEGNPKNCQYIHCDVTQWKDQLQLFKEAAAKSPSKTIDFVIANAGISGADEIFWEDKSEEPVEPQLRILQVNLVGVMYTTKLALHYFRRQYKENPDSDTCLILQGSLAGYVDLPGSLQYGGSKYALRGMMKNLRRTTFKHGSRVNYIAPWFIKTKIMSQQVVDVLLAGGTTFAETEDAAAAVLRLCCDIKANGRSLAIVPREWAPKGYKDLEVDDYKEGSEHYKWQMGVLKASYRDTVPPEQQ